MGVGLAAMIETCGLVLLRHNFDGLVQKRRNLSALAMELRLFCTKPSTKPF